MRAVRSRDVVASMVPSGDHATYHTPLLCPVTTNEIFTFVTGSTGALIWGPQLSSAHPHAIPPDDRIQGQSRVMAVVVTFPGRSAAARRRDQLGCCAVRRLML